MSDIQMAEKADSILKEFEKLKGDRLNWDSHWREIAQRVWPMHHTMFNNWPGLESRGNKRNEYILDSTAPQALQKFGAILDSLLTPRNQTWHRLKPSEDTLLRDRETKLWFDEVNRLIFKYRYSPQANFASQNQNVLQSLGAYGSGGMFIDRLADRPGLRYKSVFLAELYFKENHQGIVDTVFRYYCLSARQAAQKFGEEKLPEQVKMAAEKRPDDKFWFIHAVMPREDVDPKRVDFKGMPYASYYISETGRAVVSEGGYNSFPYATPRYNQAPNEVYGRGPAMDALPAIKTLNEQKKTQLKAGHRAVDPVLLAHDDGVLDDFSLAPGALNYGGVDANGRPLVQALKTGNYNIGLDMMDAERQVINDIFLVNLFQILVENPQMTATEVVERSKEKGMLLAPTVGRQHSEYLGPMIEREVDVLQEQGLLPPLPPALVEAQGDYTIEYDSPLSRAQRAEEGAGIMRSLEFALQIVNVTQDPSVLDAFDFDEIMRGVTDQQGVPAKWMKSLDEVMQIREGRAQQAAQQQMIEAAPGAAAMTNAAAKLEG